MTRLRSAVDRLRARKAAAGAREILPDEARQWEDTRLYSADPTPGLRVHPADGQRTGSQLAEGVATMSDAPASRAGAETREGPFAAMGRAWEDYRQMMGERIAAHHAARTGGQATAGQGGGAGPQPVPTNGQTPTGGAAGEGGGELSDYMGSVDPETGQVTAPRIGEYGAAKLEELEGAADTEIREARGALHEAETDISGREADTERDLALGKERVDQTVRAADNIADQAKRDVSRLPQEVGDELSGIADKYKETTNIDIDRIEGLGREAVGMAMEGKNAAAQAAVSAQQQALRDAEARINADPDISPSRKSAMLAQLRVNGSMQIAATIGANIKDFTQMQTTAMTATMNAVASASSTRMSGLAAMGSAEMQAVAGAYMKAADISAGFDERKIDVRQNADSIRFNYDQLTATYRDAKDGTTLALLDANNYVSQLNYDFMTNHYAIGMNILGQDFATKLQAGGYNNWMEAIADGQDWARDAALSQVFMSAIGGPAGTVLGIAPIVDDLLKAIFGGT
ncbi:hypothetical protein AMJ85_00190 [candidate division BRC1 bacterium SM23_51]|nr:MAG: hypothetical protein AMJ85_00190 [candidate division BRC1 bacterium SM23_51]